MDSPHHPEIINGIVLGRKLDNHFSMARGHAISIRDGGRSGSYVHNGFIYHTSGGERGSHWPNYYYYYSYGDDALVNLPN